MNYTEFKVKFQPMPLIFSKDVEKLHKRRQAMRNQLSRWQAKGLLVKLKRGVYLLNKNDQKVYPSLSFIANQLYQPSYISMEYALRHYGFIPEKVTDVTSITTRKTVRFKNKAGNFIYQHIKPEVFRGFKAVKGEAGLSVLIAEPEKAVVDFLYLNLDKFHKDAKRIFEHSYRFQHMDELKKNRLMALAGYFDNRRLSRVVKELCDFIYTGK